MKEFLEFLQRENMKELPPSAEQLGMVNYSVPVSIYTEKDPESGLHLLRIDGENKLEEEAGKF